MQELNLNKFRKKLAETEDEREKFIDVIKKTSDYTPGVQYLYDKFLFPLMQGKTVESTSLNFNAFDNDDISAIYNFYSDNYEARNCAFSFIKKIADECLLSPPIAASVSFI